MSRIGPLLILLLALGAPALHAQPGGDPATAVVVEGATFAELDEATGLLTLRGSPVTVRRRDMRLRAPGIIYDTKRRILRASGGVIYTAPTSTMEAPEVTVWIDEDRLMATGGVAAVQGQGTDAIRLRAARIEMFGRDRAIATGAAELISADATVQADRIEAASADELTAGGNVRIVRDDIEGRAPRLLVRRPLGIAVLSGGAVVRQGQDEARAETITVDLRRRRFTATGRAHLVLFPSR